MTKKELTKIVCNANAKKIVKEVEVKKGIIYFDRETKIENIANNLFRNCYKRTWEFLNIDYNRLKIEGYVA